LGQAARQVRQTNRLLQVPQTLQARQSYLLQQARQMQTRQMQAPLLRPTQEQQEPQTHHHQLPQTRRQVLLRLLLRLLLLQVWDTPDPCDETCVKSLLSPYHH
jgi:hypothetical protein